MSWLQAAGILYACRVFPFRSRPVVRLRVGEAGGERQPSDVGCGIEFGASERCGAGGLVCGIATAGALRMEADAGMAWVLSGWGRWMSRWGCGC